MTACRRSSAAGAGGGAAAATRRPERIQHALAVGFDDCWTRPVNVAAILERLRDESRGLDAAGTGGPFTSP